MKQTFKRGPLSTREKVEIIIAHIHGSTLEHISEEMNRPVSTIKKNLPKKGSVEWVLAEEGMHATDVLFDHIGSLQKELIAKTMKPKKKWYQFWK